MEQIMDMIERERKKQGLTMKELSTLAGLSSTVYSTWRRGVTGPTLRALCKVAEVVGLTLAIGRPKSHA